MTKDDNLGTTGQDAGTATVTDTPVMPASPTDATAASATPTTGQAAAGVNVNAKVPALPPVSLTADPKRLLWAGALVAAGVIGVLEWPVVAAVGVGTYVAEKFAKDPR